MFGTGLLHRLARRSGTNLIDIPLLRDADQLPFGVTFDSAETRMPDGSQALAKLN